MFTQNSQNYGNISFLMIWHAELAELWEISLRILRFLREIINTNSA